MNIGFSQNKQQTVSPRQRLDLIGYTDENRLGGNIKESGPSRQNRLKSSLTVIKPRHKRIKLSSVSTFPKSESQKPAAVDMGEEVLPKEPILIEPEKVLRPLETKTKINSRQDLKTRTIQIGLLNLGDIEQYGDLIRNYHLPLWQFTAFDPTTGGAWISYSYELSRERQNKFISALLKHFTSVGISNDQINFEICYDADISKKIQTIGNTKSEYYLKSDFTESIVIKNGIVSGNSQLSRFHDLLEVNFYSTTRLNSVSKLISESELFMTDYNYKTNFKGCLNLPPNQLICRQFESEFGPEILKFKPLLLDKNRLGRTRYLFGLQIMAGIIASITRFTNSRKRIPAMFRSGKITSKTKSPIMNLSKAINSAGKVKSKIEPGQRPNNRKPENKIEYISLKNMNWKKPEEKHSTVDTGAGKVRNRQELINHAKELLAQKRSIAELKNKLPMTEGELSMLSRNITFSDNERN